VGSIPAQSRRGPLDPEGAHRATRSARFRNASNMREVAWACENCLGNVMLATQTGGSGPQSASETGATRSRDRNGHRGISSSSGRHWKGPPPKPRYLSLYPSATTPRRRGSDCHVHTRNGLTCHERYLRWVSGRALQTHHTRSDPTCITCDPGSRA